MKKMIVVLLISIAVLGTKCFSEEIVIDGDFSDWVDKPSINSTDETDLNDNPEPIPQAEPESTSETEPITEPESVSEVEPIHEDASTTETETTTEPGTTTERESTAEPESEVVPKPASEPESVHVQDDKKGPKYKISQLKWMMNENSDVLYIMIRLSHGNNAQSTEITTEMLTDYGDYDIKTNYDTNDGSVFTEVNGTDITSSEGNCTVINKNTVYLEYAIPVSELIKDAKWGYQIKIKVHTQDDSEPKKDYIIISTASTGPVIGVVIAALIAVGYYYFKRKRT